LLAGDFLGEVHPLETGPIEGLCLEGCDIDSPFGMMGYGAVRRAEVPDPPRQPAGIHSGEADQPMVFQPRIERLGGAIVRRRGDRTVEDEPARSRGRRFDVFPIRPDIADMREGERDDLTGVGRIRQDFLIPGDCGVEANLADRHPARAEASAPKYRPIREDERGVAVGRSRHRLAHAGILWAAELCRTARGGQGRTAGPLRDN
jgi:hypothetical protein